MLLTGSWSHLVSRYAGLDFCLSRTGGFLFCFFNWGASSSFSITSIGIFPSKSCRATPMMAVTRSDTAHYSRQATHVYGLFSLSLSHALSLSSALSLSLSLSSALSLSLSLSLSLFGSLPTRTHSASTVGEKEGLTGCERELHEGVQETERCTEKKLKKRKLMIPPLLFQAQEVVQELLTAPKLKKAKKEEKRKKATSSATKIYTRVTWDQVRQGTGQQHGPKGFVCIKCSVSQPLFFSSQRCTPRAFLFCGPHAAERVITRPRWPCFDATRLV